MSAGLSVCLFVVGVVIVFRCRCRFSLPLSLFLQRTLFSHDHLGFPGWLPAHRLALAFVVLIAFMAAILFMARGFFVFIAFMAVVAFIAFIAITTVGGGILHFQTSLIFHA